MLVMNTPPLKVLRKLQMLEAQGYGFIFPEVERTDTKQLLSYPCLCDKEDIEVFLEDEVLYITYKNSRGGKERKHVSVFPLLLGEKESDISCEYKNGLLSIEVAYPTQTERKVILEIKT